MDQTIIWSKQAVASLERLMYYLADNHGEAYASRYHEAIQSRLAQTAKYPDSIGTPNAKRPGTRRVIFDRYIYIVYRTTKGGIEIKDIMHHKMNQRGF
jgi:plasmid stabilization system protein ParE